MSRERSGCASQRKARARITSVKGNNSKLQRGQLSKIQEEMQSGDSNFPKQYQCKDACLLPTEDTPEIVRNGKIQIRGLTWKQNRTEKELTKELHREKRILVSQQMLLETTSSRDQTKISKDFVLCWMM